jgi:hypothetical protein
MDQECIEGATPMATDHHLAPCRRTAYWIGTALILVCLSLHLPRLLHPSIYGDDVARIGDLQTRPLAGLVFLPFNEHMAPFFQSASWTTWQLAGRSLTMAPLAFTLASYLPWVLCLSILGRLIAHATGSPTTALVAVALFGITPLYAEVVYWYSASSFAWALFWTLLALHRAGTTETSQGLVTVAVCSALAPASSTLGLLAGPLASIRLGTRRPQGLFNPFRTLIPLLGTTFYLMVCLKFDYFHLIKSNVDHKADLGGGLVLALRAPVELLVPTLFGAYEADVWAPVTLSVILSGAGLIGLVLWAWRSRNRGLIGCGFLLILGGYALTYCFRNENGAHWVLNSNERFHLYPQVGLALLVALALRPWLGRYDHRPALMLFVAAGFALLLTGVHHRRIAELSQRYYFPEQGQTMAALDHLERLCRAEGVAREDAIAALDPVWSYWFQEPFNGLWMLPETGAPAGRPAGEVRSHLLAGLTGPERTAIWGGMDVSRYATLAGAGAGTEADCVATGRLIETVHAHRTVGRRGEEIGRYTMTGWPAHLDFELVEQQLAAGKPQPMPTRLCLPCGASPEPMQIWWTNDRNLWSACRSVRFRPDPNRPACSWTIPLDRLPHWDPADATRIRVLFVTAPVAIGQPRLLR